MYVGPIIWPLNSKCLIKSGKYSIESQVDSFLVNSFIKMGMFNMILLIF